MMTACNRVTAIGLSRGNAAPLAIIRAIFGALTSVDTLQTRPAYMYVVHRASTATD